MSHLTKYEWSPMDCVYRHISLIYFQSKWTPKMYVMKWWTLESKGANDNECGEMNINVIRGE